MGFTKLYGKLAVRIFLIFLCKVTGAYKLKTDLNYILGKNLALRLLSQKIHKMGPKFGFLSFMNNQWMKLFKCFARSYSSRKT